MFFEKRGFDVRTRFGDRLGMNPSYIRIFFIYLSFVTFGISTGLYLILAFLLKIKDMVVTKRTSVFDL